MASIAERIGVTIAELSAMSFDQIGSHQAYADEVAFMQKAASSAAKSKRR